MPRPAFVLPATIVAARRGFTAAPDERHAATDDYTRAREEPTALRAKPAYGTGLTDAQARTLRTASATTPHRYPCRG